MVLINIEGPNGGQVRDETVAGAIVLVAWSMEADFRGAKVFSQTIGISNDGGKFLVQAGGASRSGAIGNGHCYAGCDADVEEICVELLP